MVEVPYSITVRLGAWDGLFDVVRSANTSHRVAIITDRNVAKRYGPRVARMLGGATTFAIPAGERFKNRKTWATLTDRLLAAGFGRDTTIVALGGGVVGDIAGFVAATYMRGVPYVQVPTTLLAMVDASIGGKTGVDTRHGKNLVGAFHQPAAVVIDPSVLKTLPAEHIRAGFAEILKHGVVADADYFASARQFAERRALDGRQGMSELTTLIERSVAIKASIVSRDEREGGLRKLLNFGHTIGHAIEAAAKYRVLHGNAIAIGQVFEARLAERLGIAAHGTAQAIADACRSAGLPTALPKASPAALLKFTHADKKARGGRVEYALPTRIGAMAGEGSGWAIPVEDTLVREMLSNRA